MEHTMQTIQQKLAKVLPTARAAGFTEDEARHLIHATGGSPRRAKRLMRTDPDTARAMAQAFREGLEAGEPFASLLQQARAAWPSLTEPTEAPEGGEGDDAAEPEAAAPAPAAPAPEPAAPVRRRRRSPPPAAAAAALAALL
jgi:hypothetical protein